MGHRTGRPPPKPDQVPSVKRVKPLFPSPLPRSGARITGSRWLLSSPRAPCERADLRQCVRHPAGAAPAAGVPPDPICALQPAQGDATATTTSTSPLVVACLWRHPSQQLETPWGRDRISAVANPFLFLLMRPPLSRRNNKQHDTRRLGRQRAGVGEDALG